MKVNLKMIEELCYKYRNSGDSDLYVGSQIPTEKLENAVRNFPIEGAKVVYLIYDTSAFNKFKTGVAICDNGVFLKNNKLIMESSKHLTWEELANCTIYKSEYDLCFDEKYKINGFDYGITIYGDARDTIEEMLDDIRYIVRDYSQDEDEYEEEESEEEDYLEGIPDMPEGNSKDSKWMLATGGTQYGPLSEDAIKNMFDKGTINPLNTYLWKKGMEDWELIINIEKFISYMRRSNPRLVPPPLPKK